MPQIKQIAIIIIFVLSAFAATAAALPSAFTKEGNPALYKKLKPLATENLRKLEGSQKRAYQKLLKEQDDILMAYLLAYESDASLCIADPKDVLSNYLAVRTLLNTRGTTHDPEFFLSYVADQTVADERIQAYREVFLRDGLREIMETAPNEMELYRAVTQWCIAKLQFLQTSGRDQSPLNITQKSLQGRCEEGQIIFVAAARTAGIPARAASTPWWPHQDNNHAWAEAWLDNGWHYTGDYYYDQDWFSGMIDKTVLILADGSLPSPKDEVLARGRYDSVINSTRNYAGDRTRTIKVLTVDEDGNSVAETALGIMVYNWGTLRPLTFVQCDADGKFEFSAGRGAFYLTASKDSLQALALVPSGTETTIDVTLTLTAADFADQDEMLLYPGNPYEWKQAPQSWHDNGAVRKAEWTADDKRFKEQGAWLADSLATQMAVACRGNYPQWKRFTESVFRVDPRFVRHLLAGDVKYLWQGTSEQFAALYNFWKTLDPDNFTPEELQSLVNPAIFYEELSPPAEWRKGKPQLYPRSFVQKGKTERESFEKAMTWMSKKYQINSAKALQGLIPINVAAKRKYLNGYQYRTLAVAVARANGIPAEFTRMPNFVYVLLDGDWTYYALTKNTTEQVNGDGEEQEFTLKVQVADELGLPQKINTEQLAVSRFQDGQFFQLNQEFKPGSKGIYRAQLPRGEYYLNMGYRVSDAKTSFQMRHLDGSQADTLSVQFTLREYPHSWEILPEDSELLDLISEVYTEGRDVLLIGNFDQENSMRVAEKLRGLGKNFVWIGYDPDPKAPANYFVSNAWHELTAEDQRNRMRTITLVQKEGVWQVYEGLWERFSE